MKQTLFKELLRNVEAAAAIRRRERSTSRIFRVQGKKRIQVGDVGNYIERRKRADKAFAEEFETGCRKVVANAVTARTLEASKLGIGVERFGSKKDLFDDIGL